MDDNSYKETADCKIASFDRAYTNNHLRMLKICLHYIPEAYRRYLSIYIKYMELHYVLAFSSSFQMPSIHPKTSESEIFQSDNDSTASPCSSNSFTDIQSITSLLRELLFFSTPREKQQFQTIENIISNMEQMKNMKEMMEMMKDMKDMFGDSDGGFNPEMFAGMMGMDEFDFFNRKD